MVTLQILVLSFLVRIQVAQQKKGCFNEGSVLFIVSPVKGYAYKKKLFQSEKV